VDINNKQFLAMMHPELGIFSMASTEVQSVPPPPPAPVTRELPVPKERGRQMSRENSRSMPVD
jgi:hypothetical protein